MNARVASLLETLVQEVRRTDDTTESAVGAGVGSPS